MPNPARPHFRLRSAFAPGCRRCLPRISGLLKRRNPQSILQSRNLKTPLRGMAYRRRHPRPRGWRRRFRPSPARRKLPQRLRGPCCTIRSALSRRSLWQRLRFQRHRSLPIKEPILERIPVRLSQCPCHLLLHSLGLCGRSLRIPVWSATHRRHRPSWYPPEHCRSHCLHRPRRPSRNHLLRHYA